MLQRLLGKLKNENGNSCNHQNRNHEKESINPTPCFKRLHEKEKQNFLNLLEQTGQSLSSSELQVVDEFLKHEGHLSADFIYNKIKERDLNISKETIKEILGLLCRYGLAQRVLLNGKGPWYEHLHIGENHDHLMCTRCGKVVEFYDENIKKLLASPAKDLGFEPLFHKTTIYGICKECKDKQGARLPLTMISPGEKVEIVEIAGGEKVKRRLTDLGLLVGEKIEVIGKTGPIILNVKGSRLALGKGVAQKILVCPISN